jgi:hypothetical protein
MDPYSAPVPEPGTLVLLAVGSVTLLLWRRRRWAHAGRKRRLLRRAVPQKRLPLIKHERPKSMGLQRNLWVSIVRFW